MVAENNQQCYTKKLNKKINFFDDEIKEMQ